MEIRDWLKATKSKDIMVRDVETLRTSDPLHYAAAVLLNEQISGAPVIDDAGVCVGVLSTSDFLGAEEKALEQRQEVADSSLFNTSLALPSHLYAQKLEEVRDKLAPAAEQPVMHFMTDDVVRVEKETPISTVIQHMVDAHVHRVVVLDENDRLRGIISTTDILAALLRVGGEVGVFAES